MKRRSLILITLIPFMACSCSNAVTKTMIDITMTNQFGDEIGEGEYTDSCEYNDDWFFEDLSELNYGLALLSSMTGGASYSNSTDINGTNIAADGTHSGFLLVQHGHLY